MSHFASTQPQIVSHFLQYHRNVLRYLKRLENPTISGLKKWLNPQNLKNGPSQFDLSKVKLKTPQLISSVQLIDDRR